LAPRGGVLRHGRVGVQGPADAVFAAPQHDYTRALMAAAFSLEADPSLDLDEHDDGTASEPMAEPLH
jgi:ABC-type glutathione transport system ATPase component